MSKIEWKAVFSRWREKGGYRWLVLAGAAGMLLLTLPGLGGGEAQEQLSADGTAQISTRDYAALLEDSLQESLEKMEGVGNVQVLITLESGAEKVYLTEEKSSTDRSEAEGQTEVRETRENSYVMTDSQRSTAPVLRYERTPQVLGVVVICDGGDNTVIQQKITQVVTTAYHISSNQVIVTK